MSRKLALVVHRYGAEVDGGSEALARQVAHGLAARDEVEVWTSCARDYLTWANELPAGTSQDGPVRVRRFPVDRARRIRPFGRMTRRLVAGPHTRAHELRWMDLQGPRLLSLLEALRTEGGRFDAVLFFTYLYFPTFLGLPIVNGRSVLVPTAHDEPPLYFSIFEELFRSAAGFVFQTPEEMALVERRFGVGARASAVAGVSIQVPEGLDPGGFRRKFALQGPLIVCVGRVDRVKGARELARAFLAYRESGGVGTLVYLGSVRTEIPRDPAIRCLGWVDEGDKWNALAAADVSVVASCYESLSLAFLESAAVGTPVLAYGESEVLVGQCRRLGAGRTFPDWESFPAALGQLVADGEARAELGRAGRRSVAELPGWDRVLDGYRSVIDEVRAS